MSRPKRMLDLFCGRWGWSRAFAARGWECVGVDILPRAIAEEHMPMNCRYYQRDLLTLTRITDLECQFGLFDAAVASSPCENFTLFQLANFHPTPPYPEMGIRLFNHTRSLLEERGLPYVMENVRGAEQFVGRAVNHSGSFYLWGNSVPPLIPKNLRKGMKMDRAWCQELGGHGSAKRDAQTAGFATIPPELANCVAEYAERLLEGRAA